MQGRWRAAQGVAQAKSAAGIYGGPRRPISLPLTGCRCVWAAGAEATEALPKWMMSGKLVESGCPCGDKTTEESLFKPESHKQESM